MQVAIVLPIVATTAWLGYDASQRDWTGNAFADATWKWIVGSLLLWIIVFPVYLVQRSKVPPAHEDYFRWGDDDPSQGGG